MSTAPAPTTPPPADTTQEVEAPATSVEEETSGDAPPSVTMPESSIAAAQLALNHALEAASIAPDEEELPAGAKEGDVETDGGPKTVFDDASSFNVKHPLYSPWTLWYESAATKNLPKAAPATPAAGGAPPAPNPHAGGWMDNVRPVVSFNSVEEFWGLNNNIVPPSQLPPKANYYLFKESIIPAWEDDANHDGGKWSVQVPKDKSKASIDQMWLYTMLAAIGETFETPLPSVDGSEAAPAPSSFTSDLITGVILSTRPAFYRLAIWTRHSPSKPESEFEQDELAKRITAVGKHFKTAVLGFQEDDRLGGGYQTEVEWIKHSDSEKKDKKTVRKIIA
ncbi:translation initiation factor eIF 4e-like domain-containing protein [Mrakia frigida]|uniref:eukaryotic translation initiation factor 4E n=1 Tax=Mrakia frigida TaxID=29902 RepID=UPI003FCC0799